MSGSNDSMCCYWFDYLWQLQVNKLWGEGKIYLEIITFFTLSYQKYEFDVLNRLRLKHKQCMIAKELLDQRSLQLDLFVNE